MNFIVSKKVRVVAAPEPPPPPFIGTRIKVKIPHTEGGALEFGFVSMQTHGDPFTLDWGDGTVEEGSQFLRKIHTYAAPGIYEIRASTGVYTQTFTVPNIGYDVLYGPSVLSYVCNDIAMDTLGVNAFCGCVNMATFDVRESSCKRLLKGVLKDCVKLSGELYFPKVSQLQGEVGTMPFEGCTGGITKIHFAEAVEADITSSATYLADPTLGTGTALCVFDLK